MRRLLIVIIGIGVKGVLFVLLRPQFIDPRQALRSQFPILALMVLYTVVSLWIIAQDSVEP